MLTRQHPDDKLVTRYQTHGGTMIEWESHETGKRYGGLFPSEQGTQIMIEEGLNPYEFEQALGL